MAILDTGYEPRNPIIRANRRRITKYRDFTIPNTSASPCDVSGHGTHGLGLILRTACHAEVYVARVGETIENLSEATVAEVRY